MLFPLLLFILSVAIGFLTIALLSMTPIRKFTPTITTTKTWTNGYPINNKRSVTVVNVTDAHPHEVDAYLKLMEESAIKNAESFFDETIRDIKL